MMGEMERINAIIKQKTQEKKEREEREAEEKEKLMNYKELGT